MFNNLSTRQLKEISNKTLVYIIIVYVFFILGRSVWQNFQLKKQIDNIKNDIYELQTQNKNLENLIIYYQSDSFKEVEARAKLGLKKPGETAIAVAGKKYENYQAETNAQVEHAARNSVKDESPNWKKWWKYFTE